MARTIAMSLFLLARPIRVTITHMKPLSLIRMERK
jgi:hypothetical protein